MSIILDFLSGIPTGQPIEVNSRDFFFAGVPEAFDDWHLVLKGDDGLCLVRMDEITDIQWYPVVEVVA